MKANKYSTRRPTEIFYMKTNRNILHEGQQIFYMKTNKYSTRRPTEIFYMKAKRNILHEGRVSEGL
jgi:hypothetical protein